MCMCTDAPRSPKCWRKVAAGWGRPRKEWARLRRPRWVVTKAFQLKEVRRCVASTMDLPSSSLRVGAATTGEGGGEVSSM